MSAAGWILRKTSSGTESPGRMLSGPPHQRKGQEREDWSSNKGGQQGRPRELETQPREVWGDHCPIRAGLQGLELTEPFISPSLPLVTCNLIERGRDLRWSRGGDPWRSWQLLQAEQCISVPIKSSPQKRQYIESNKMPVIKHIGTQAY